MRPYTRTSIAPALATMAALTLALGGCSGSPQAASSPHTPVDCTAANLPTLTDGVLTVGAGEPYSPWYIGTPEEGKGFESALVYAVADRLGYDIDDVRWTTVTFEQIVSPGIKTFDVAAYQASISDARRSAVDFSSPYLTTRQGVIVLADGPFASATTLADLDGARIGVTAAQTSLDIAKAAFGAGADIVPFSAAGDGMRALESGTIDAMVMDVDQGMSAASEYFPNSEVIGTLPAKGDPEEYGLVLDLGSPLTACVSEAIDELQADGTLDQLRATWLKSDDVPELS